MSAGDIDFILQLWAAFLTAHHESPPFSNHTEMYSAIDSTPLGDVPWESFSLEYDVWFQDPLGLVHKILSNPDFRDEIDYALVQEYNSNGVHR